MRANVRRMVVKKRGELMQKKNVVGVMSGREHKNGQATERDAVCVLVKEKLPMVQLADEDLVPRNFLENGQEIPTDVIEVGEIRALHKAKHRPLLPGTSIGHFAITAGTLGIVVVRGGQEYILSNNHVLANENDAQAGDAILQPGPHDGGTENDKVAELVSFVPISFNSVNKIDAALAKFVGFEVEDPIPEPDPEQPDEPEHEDFIDRVLNFFETIFHKLLSLIGIRKDEQLVQSAKSSVGAKFINEPLNLGPITGQIAEVDVGDTVKKSGRTTGVTVDQVIGIDASANVGYDKGTATFVDQIICGPMSAGGDSGSIVYDDAGNAIGLLFAGSDKVTIVNRIQDVFDTMGIERIA